MQVPLRRRWGPGRGRAKRSALASGSRGPRGRCCARASAVVRLCGRRWDARGLVSGAGERFGHFDVVICSGASLFTPRLGHRPGPAPDTGVARACRTGAPSDGGGPPLPRSPGGRKAVRAAPPGRRFPRVTIGLAWRVDVSDAQRAPRRGMASSDFPIPAESELRVEIPNDKSVGITLLEGTAEIFGTEVGHTQSTKETTGGRPQLRAPPALPKPGIRGCGDACGIDPPFFPPREPESRPRLRQGAENSPGGPPCRSAP